MVTKAASQALLVSKDELHCGKGKGRHDGRVPESSPTLFNNFIERINCSSKREPCEFIAFACPCTLRAGKAHGGAKGTCDAKAIRQFFASLEVCKLAA